MQLKLQYQMILSEITLRQYKKFLKIQKNVDDRVS